MARPELHPESKKFLEVRAKFNMKLCRELGSVDAARAQSRTILSRRTPAVQYTGSRKELFIPQPDSSSGNCCKIIIIIVIIIVLGTVVVIAVVVDC